MVLLAADAGVVIFFKCEIRKDKIKKDKCKTTKDKKTKYKIKKETKIQKDQNAPSMIIWIGYDGSAKQERNK